LRPEHLAEIIGMVEGKLITTNTGKELLEKVEESGRAPADIVAAEGLSQVSDDSRLRLLAEEVLAESPDQLNAYRNGKTTLIGWFVGQVMRKTGGKAEPQRTRAILEDLLSE
jgi:aspartyl-tRNA(Asn)/glutamyl-tRNA(Gln) amidotransferase subunit B